MLTVADLENGIRFWRTTKWPQDFHEYFYEHDLPPTPANTDFEAWWTKVLPILRAWKATRPKGASDLELKARESFPELRDAWNKKIAPQLHLDIAMVEWSHLSTFVSIVSAIKGVSSPVFASKLCHFLAPQIFPVIDNKAMGKPFATYYGYFAASKAEWAATDTRTQDALIKILTDAVTAGRTSKNCREPLFFRFPTKCKIIELCFIGRNND
jgi:hypothetical protein